VKSKALLFKVGLLVSRVTNGRTFQNHDFQSSALF